jgi:hypothetical protein
MVYGLAFEAFSAHMARFFEWQSYHNSERNAKWRLDFTEKQD